MQKSDVGNGAGIGLLFGFFLWLALLMLAGGCEPAPSLEYVEKYEDTKVQVSEHEEGIYVFHSQFGSFSATSFADALARFLKDRPTKTVEEIAVINRSSEGNEVYAVLVVTRER